MANYYHTITNLVPTNTDYEYVYFHYLIYTVIKKTLSVIG